MSEGRGAKMVVGAVWKRKGDHTNRVKIEDIDQDGSIIVRRLFVGSVQSTRRTSSQTLFRNYEFAYMDD